MRTPLKFLIAPRLRLPDSLMNDYDLSDLERPVYEYSEPGVDK